ncbi:MAG TPA: hypothetical protein VK837_11865, partial [Longimicrobiales bacterium]|nr:hypothetical protein [Longimicrobiales bacterium]
MNGFTRFVGELRRRSVWRVLAIYVAGGWVAFEVSGSLAETIGLPDWFPGLALALLIVGLPIVIATALVQEEPAARETAVGRVADASKETAAAGAPRPSREMASEAPPGPAPHGRGARRLLTWRNATIGGLAAALAWAAVATAWLVLGGPPRSRAAAGPG